MDLSEATRKFLEKKCTCAKCKAQKANPNPNPSSGCQCQAKQDSCAALLSFGGRSTPAGTQAGGGCPCGAPPVPRSLSSKPVGECDCAAAAPAAHPAAPPSSMRSGGCCAPAVAPSSTKTGGGCACVGPSAAPSSTKFGAACGHCAPSAKPSSTKSGAGCACSGPAAKPVAAQNEDEPCDCAAAEMDNRVSESYSREDSYNTSPINFGGATFGRKSSNNDPFYPPAYSGGKKSHAGCSGSLEYSSYPSNIRYNTGMAGRDTLNTPIHLPGLLNTTTGGTCGQHIECEWECGWETGCNTLCKTKRTGSETAGVHICNNEMVNMLVSFMLEAFGILVFFAVCTFTFWIALGFYITQLLVDLKKADRNIHVAIGIVLSLLILAFAITMVTHGSKSCPHRAVNVIKSSGCSSKPKVLIPKPPCPASSCPKPKPKPMPKPRVVPCKAKPKPKVVPCNKFRPKTPVMRRKYTDCQGRAIYETSRRNSVLIEMKQPPTWLVWVGENLNNYLNNREIR